MLRQPVKVVVGEKNAATYTVEQSLVVCGREDGKLVALRQMVREGLRPPVLIFMLSVEQAMQLFHALVYDGLRVDVLHAEHTAAQREATVSKFRAGQVLTRGRARARPRKHTARRMGSARGRAHNSERSDSGSRQRRCIRCMCLD